LICFQSLESGFSGFRGGEDTFGFSTDDASTPGVLVILLIKRLELRGSADVPSPEFIAGVPIPDKGLTRPLEGTGILISSGDPGMIFSATPGIIIRFASF
jgi:hypothetical protein